MKKIFTITKKESNQRLDKFLIKHFPEYSRVYLQKQIKSGAVLVHPVRNLPKVSKNLPPEPQAKSLRKNKTKLKHGWISNGVNWQIKKPSYILKDGDRIETNIKPPEKISLTPDPSIKLNMIYEDNDVLVIDKPAGLTVHPSDTQKNGTLVNGLIAYYPLLKNVGDDALRPGIVHRLDKDTSGLMIVAKNNQAFTFLKNQFKNKQVEKKYLALVVGKPKELSGVIKTFITRSKSDPTKQKVSASPTDREAITDYKTIREFKNFTLLEAQPKTGRMHQIRVHLAYIGCPVAGDQKYGRKNQIVLPELKRQFLHAASLKVTLPNERKRTFFSPLPSDLKRVLGSLET